jgi:acyl dehydratase
MEAMPDDGEPTRTLSDADVSTSPADRYFEDYRPGSVFEYGHVLVTAEDIITFASMWDPQPIHTDRAFAARGPFGGLIASGLHTTGICMRLYVTHYLSHAASLASPGMDELRWPTPVRPGDLLRLRTTVVATRASRSRPDRGLVHTRAELFNHKDELVLHLLPVNILGRAGTAGGD